MRQLLPAPTRCDKEVSVMGRQSVPTIDEIICPSCGTNISVADQLRGPLRAELAVELRPEIERGVRRESDDRLAELTDSVSRLETENAGLKDNERDLRKERDELERKKRDFDLLLARELDRSRREIFSEAETRVRDAFALKLKERDETIERMTSDLEAARRRAVQAPSELHGTVQEQALDEVLRIAFPDDEITRVARGRAGADIVQHVRTRNGGVAGTIIWESKRAKTFNRAWIPALKRNARSAQADVAVLVTSTLPDEAHLVEREGVWIVSLRLAAASGAILRGGLIAVARASAATERREGLAGPVYDYVTSTRFRDLVTDALGQLAEEARSQEQEENALGRLCARRRQFLQRQAGNWAALVGNLEGVGADLPGIPLLELPAGDAA